MKLRRILTLAACISSLAGAALVYAATGAADADKSALEKRLNEVLVERLKSAQRALEATQAAYDADTITLDVLLDASNKLADAEEAIMTRPDHEIAALSRNVERLQQIEKKIKTLFELGTRGGEAMQYAAAQRERATAEVALLRAQIKAKQ